MIRQFLEQILGEQEGNAVIGLRDSSGPDGKVNRFTFFPWPAAQDAMVAYAEKHKAEDLYYSPILYGERTNERGKISRTPENALTTQVIYTDADTAEPSRFRLPPSIVVQTSTGRYHCYWYLSEPVTADLASEISHRVTTAHEAEGSDPNGWSANKVLRLPDSVNTSHGFPEAVTVHYTGEIYSVWDVSGAYDDVQVVERAKFRPSSDSIAQAPEDLPDYADTLDKLSKRTMELALAEPTDTQDRSRLRYKLLLELIREGLSIDEVLSIAWHSPACRKWSQDDPRGFAGLAAEAGKAQAEIQAENGEFTEAPEREVETVDTVVSILSDKERAQLDGEFTFIDRYVALAATLVPKQNRPYDEINAWMVLSATFADAGYIPRRSGPEYCNFYSMTIGDTTTGKSAARKLKMFLLNDIFAGDAEFNIGGSPSPSGLSRKLVDRDGLVSYYNKDEAHGNLKLWTGKAGGEWTTGLLEDFADMYDGKVTGSLRAKREDGEGKTAETFFLMDLMGTPKAMMAALSRDLFGTGFLARFQWAVGDPREVTRDSMAEEDAEGEAAHHGFNTSARQLACDLLRAKLNLRERLGTRRFAVTIDKNAARRLQDAKWDLNKMFEKHQNWEILEPSLVRLGVTIRKAASLLAMSEGGDVVTLRHILLALHAAEGWVKNLVTVSTLISASDYERATDEIFAFIRDKGDAQGEIRREVVMRRFRSIEGRFMDNYIKGLIDQGRIRAFVGDNRSQWLAVK